MRNKGAFYVFRLITLAVLGISCMNMAISFLMIHVLPGFLEWFGHSSITWQVAVVLLQFGFIVTFYRLRTYMVSGSKAWLRGMPLSKVQYIVVASFLLWLSAMLRSSWLICAIPHYFNAAVVIDMFILILWADIMYTTVVPLATFKNWKHFFFKR